MGDSLPGKARQSYRSIQSYDSIRLYDLTEVVGSKKCRRPLLSRILWDPEFFSFTCGDLKGFGSWSCRGWMSRLIDQGEFGMLI
jgi:hypothetical protein